MYRPGADSVVPMVTSRLVNRGHGEGDDDGMLLVLMLDQDAGGDRAKDDNATYTCVNRFSQLELCDNTEVISRCALC